MQIDPKNFLSYPVWLAQPQATRYKIAALFDLKPAGVRETYFGPGGGQVISDGFLHKDLAVITRERMTEITGVQSDDFYVLFNALVEFVNKPKVEEVKEEIKQLDVQQEKPAEAVGAGKKKAGRPRKGAETKGGDIKG